MGCATAHPLGSPNRAPDGDELEEPRPIPHVNLTASANLNGWW
jgi:hypothetical protein